MANEIHAYLQRNHAFSASARCVSYFQTSPPGFSIALGTLWPNEWNSHKQSQSYFNITGILPGNIRAQWLGSAVKSEEQSNGGSGWGRRRRKGKKKKEKKKRQHTTGVWGTAIALIKLAFKGINASSWTLFFSQCLQLKRRLNWEQWVRMLWFLFSAFLPHKLTFCLSWLTMLGLRNLKRKKKKKKWIQKSEGWIHLRRRYFCLFFIVLIVPE